MVLKVIINKIIKFLNTPSKVKISEQDLAEWRRIEGIDQYIKKRN